MVWGRRKDGRAYEKRGHVPHQRSHHAGHGTPKIIGAKKSAIVDGAKFLFNANKKFKESKRLDAMQEKQKEAKRILDENKEITEEKPTISKEEIEQQRRTKQDETEKNQEFDLFEGGGAFKKSVTPETAPQQEPEKEMIVGRNQGIPVSNKGNFYFPDNENMRILDSQGQPVDNIEDAKRILQDMEIAKAEANKTKVNSEELRAEESVLSEQGDRGSSGKKSKGLEPDLVREELNKTLSGMEFLGEH